MTRRTFVASTVAVTLAATVSIAMFNGPARADESSSSKEPATMPAAAEGPLSFVVKDIKGQDHDLSQYRGKVVMIVNTASRCGLTPQYEALEKLYRDHKDAGLVVLGFPANNFNGQEPGTNEQIAQFCSTKYDVTFPMMGKVSVKGDDKHPLYKHLTEPPTAGDFAGDVKWNFGKFLVGRDGKVVARFEPKTKPDSPEVVEAVEKALASTGG